MIEIDGHHLTISDVVAVARRKEPVSLSTAGREAILRSRSWLEQILREDKPVYGINTGFGIFAEQRIKPEASDRLSRNLILSHAVATGTPFSDDIVRAAMLIRANTLARGHSGVR
ncbi:aromatic amino acid lyase, partial [Thermanaerothrix sp.]|uniref:aromatic amino acid lyase n=1 Tax=Thermanaerothrix sp. TaxID=2972675 RepID=UPI003C7E192C